MQRLQLPQHPHAIAARHVDVEDEDIGTMALDRGQRVLAVGGRAHDFEVRLALEELLEALEDHAVIVGQDEADHAAPPIVIPSVAKDLEGRGGGRPSHPGPPAPSRSLATLGMTEEADHALSPANPSGTAISTCAPASLESTVKSPFSAATRSASMNGPLPVSRMRSSVSRRRKEKPTPSSLTSMRIFPPAVCTRTSTFFAAPCLAEFIPASCTSRNVS